MKKMSRYQVQQMIDASFAAGLAAGLAALEGNVILGGDEISIPGIFTVADGKLLVDSDGNTHITGGASLSGDTALTGSVVMVTNAPTADPEEFEGQLWSDTGVLTLSVGA